MRFFLLALLLCCCTSPPSLEKKKPLVLVSLPPYVHLVKKLASELVDVESLVPEGSNPHLYEAPLQKIERQQKADLWIYLGESVDKKMTRLLKQGSPDLPTLDLTAGIDLLSSENSHLDEGRDLHVWLDMHIVRVQAERIAACLKELLPHETERIQENLLKFLNELATLDETLYQLLAPLKGSPLLVSHPAFGYFCRAYGLRQISIEEEGKDPGPKDLTLLLEEAQKKRATLVVVEPQHSSKGAERIAHLLNLPLYTIDPYSERYLSELLALARMLAQ